MSRGVRPQYSKKVNAASRRRGKSVSLGSSSTRVSDLKESFSIFVATWNLNGKPSCSMSALRKLILGAGGVASPKLHDIVVIGLQEMVPLNVTNVVLSDSAASRRASKWNKNIERVLNSTTETYSLVGAKHIVGIHLCVFVRATLYKHVSYVSADISKVGVAGVMGNKGASAIRFRFFKSTLCFVCSHLAARRSAVAARNENFHHILDTLFSTATHFSRRVDPAPPRVSSVLHHDHIIWIGDLNYRIASGLTALDVLKHINNNELEVLRKQDQLNIERKAGRVFEGFEEGELWFKPTYKYNTKPPFGMYDLGPETGRSRAPAWCDRVLWSSSPGLCVLEEYGRKELLCSDHMPVHATLKLKIPVAKPARRRRCRVALRIWCKHLRARNPFVRLFTPDKKHGSWVAVGKTETVHNKQSPCFKTTLNTDFACNMVKQLLFEVYDSDLKGNDSLLGCCSTTVAAIMTTPGNLNTFQLVDNISNAKEIKENSTPPATLSVRLSFASANSNQIKFQLAAHNLDGWILTCDPIYVVSKPDKTTSSKWASVFTSEHIENNPNPKWNAYLLNAQKIGMECDNSKVKIHVYDWNAHTDSAKTLIGSCVTTLGELKAKQTKHTDNPTSQFLKLKRRITTKKHRKGSLKNSGFLEVVSIKKIKHATLLDFLVGGLEIDLTIGLDFTAKGPAAASSSATSVMKGPCAGGLQKRLSVLHALGSVLQGYDTDKVLHAYGFGAQAPGFPSACFPLGPDNQPNVYKIEGALRAYDFSLTRSDVVPLSGPTDLVPMLLQMRRNVVKPISQDQQKYQIIMIMVDSAIDNLKRTMDVITSFSKLPVSIVLVGVGTDFSSMNKLQQQSRPSVGVKGIWH